MEEEARVSFFEIGKCGFYLQKATQPSFGDCQHLFDDLKRWLSGKTIRDTNTFTPDDDSSLNPTYCFDMNGVNKNGDYLITTWNEVVSEDGKMPSVSGDQGVGTAGIELSELPAGAIPGFPSYIWILPALSKIATIQFGGFANGRKNFDQYVKSYAGKFSGYVAFGPRSEGENVIVGYREAGEPQNLLPLFQTVPIRLRGKINFLVGHYASIRKVVRKELLKKRDTENLEFVQKLFKFFGAQIPKTMSDDLPLKFEMPYSPSKDELMHLIAEWEFGHAARWDDIGFELAGDPATYWLSRSRASTHVKLDVKRDKTGALVSGDSLLDALTKQRDSLILTYSDVQ